MGNVVWFVVVYTLGGVTFIPLMVIVVLMHAYFSFPTISRGSNVEQDPLDKRDELSLAKELGNVDKERDAAAGYFAVCREFVAGGVKGKPLERLRPGGEVIAVESASVYQSMYRSIFERGKGQGPRLEGGGGNIKRNVFYVVLRHGHLMLYDNAEQVEVRHIISLGLYEVDVYSGGEEIAEGELWVKRNCIRLKRRESGSVGQDSKPYFLFGDNCSEKEDFFHALIQNQHRSSSTSERPTDTSQRPTGTSQFAPENMVKLIQQLHASEEMLQTRWFNALLGRLFLSLYRTSKVQSFILAKITKKLTRIQKPTFIEDIKVGRIDLGNAAPLFMNPKLRELTLDGELIIETDVRYSGNFKLEIEATALIDLGQRFKVRRIDILLAVLCKSLEGHLLVKIKPPPSNRLWISFETMPRMELSIEPIVSSRQITYGIILRTIESKIREVMGETVVFPNWDDVPFHDTRSQAVRGGIWDDEAASDNVTASVPSQTQTDEDGAASDNVTASVPSQTQTDEEEAKLEPSTVLKSHSTPSLIRRRPVGSGSSGKAKTINGDVETSTSTGRESIDIGKKSKSSRSSSFAAASTLPVSISPTHASAIREDGQYTLQDAVSSMKGFSGLSSSTSSGKSETPTDTTQTNVDNVTTVRDESEDSKGPEEQDIFALEMPDDYKLPPHNGSLMPSIENLRRPHTEDFEKKRKSMAANGQVTAAAAAAKKWGFDFVAKRASQTSNDSNSDLSTNTSITSIPIGRGQPLPPPGTPLPGPPVRKTWATAAFESLNKKKTGSSPSIGGHASDEHVHEPPPFPPRPTIERTEIPKNPSPPNPSTRTRKHSGHTRRGASIDKSWQPSAPDDILVIKAPDEDVEGESDIEKEEEE